MRNAVSTFLRQATRRSDEPLNILTFPTHERWETGLCLTGHQFWAIRGQGIKNWDMTYAPLPANYTLLDPAKNDQQIPAEIDFDLILSQNKAGQMQIATQISRKLQLPLVSLEHTLPLDAWKGQLGAIKQMRGHINVFISEYSRAKWGWGENEADVIHHGVDYDLFSQGEGERKTHALSVVNDWINRDVFCGYNLWKEATDGLPVLVIGATPGLSKPAPNVHSLVQRYQQAQVFVNTSLISPVPTSLLEAMSCGCAVVSSSTCMIPEIIEHGVNGFLGTDAQEIHHYTKMLLADRELAGKLGEQARRTIVERFSMASFVENWRRLLARAANLVVTNV